jgi:hypothetical protein
MMLEALVSLALLVGLLGFVLPLLADASLRQGARLDALKAAEFAVSTVEEFRVRYPFMPPSGQDPSGWNWEIAETPVSPDGPTSLDPVMQLAELQVSVWHDTREERFTFDTIVARPR